MSKITRLIIIYILLVLLITSFVSATTTRYIDNTAQISDGDISYKINDRLGNDRLTINNDNMIVASNNLPYGQQLKNNNVKFSFTGKELDDTDNYYFNARYYDFDSGKFLGVDPVSDNQAYSYVSNNPMNYIDPTGKDMELHHFNNDDGSLNPELVQFMQGLEKAGINTRAEPTENGQFKLEFLSFTGENNQYTNNIISFIKDSTYDIHVTLLNNQDTQSRTEYLKNTNHAYVLYNPAQKFVDNYGKKSGLNGVRISLDEENSFIFIVHELGHIVQGIDFYKGNGLVMDEYISVNYENWARKIIYGSNARLREVYTSSGPFIEISLKNNYKDSEHSKLYLQYDGVPNIDMIKDQAELKLFYKYDTIRGYPIFTYLNEQELDLQNNAITSMTDVGMIETLPEEVIYERK